MNTEIEKYNNTLSQQEKIITDILKDEINKALPESESKLYHSNPAWFLEGNPIVGYTKLKDCIQLLFWSGQSFDESGLKDNGKFKAAEARYINSADINIDELRQWLKKSREIQWDYKNIVKRKGELVRLK